MKAKKRTTSSRSFLVKLEHLKSKRTRTEAARDKHILDVLSLLPADMPLDKLKFAYVDKIIADYDGNLSAAARALDVPYRTMVSWVHYYHRVAKDLDELRSRND